MSGPLAMALRRFSPPQGEASARPPAPVFSAATTLTLDSAREAGVAEGRAAAGAEWASRLEAVEASRAGDLAAARRGWIEEESARLAEILRADLGRATREIEERLAGALAAPLFVAVRAALLADFHARLAHLLNGEGARVSLRGPRDLVMAIAARLGPDAARCVLLPDEGAELVAESGATTISTRCEAWRAALAPDED